MEKTESNNQERELINNYSLFISALAWHLQSNVSLFLSLISRRVETLIWLSPTSLRTRSSSCAPTSGGHQSFNTRLPSPGLHPSLRLRLLSPGGVGDCRACPASLGWAYCLQGWNSVSKRCLNDAFARGSTSGVSLSCHSCLQDSADSQPTNGWMVNYFPFVFTIKHILSLCFIFLLQLLWNNSIWVRTGILSPKKDGKPKLN